MRTIIAALSLVCLVMLSGCSARMTEGEKDSAIAGGIVGPIVGAGAGAAIGASIANGDIGMSALVGAGVGLPLGIAGGLILHEVALSEEIASNDSRIDANRQDIRRSQRELDQYREQLDTDTMSIDPDREKGEYRYEGPSLGNYMR